MYNKASPLSSKLAQLKHSDLCEWDGKSHRTTMKIGRCIACDHIKAVRAEKVDNTGVYGIHREDMHKYCKSDIQAARCTKYTNPSCACGKPILNGTA